MTRAPRSASWRVQNRAAIACSSVATVMPSSGRISAGGMCGSRRRAGPAYRGLRADVRPALLLLLHDLGDAGRDVLEVGQHVRARQLLSLHRVLARGHLDARRDRLVEASG